MSNELKTILNSLQAWYSANPSDNADRDGDVLAAIHHLEDAEAFHRGYGQ